MSGSGRRSAVGRPVAPPGPRQVSPGGSRPRGSPRPLSAMAIALHGTEVHLRGYGVILVFRIDTPDGDTEYWATSKGTMTPSEREQVATQSWTIETYHRGLQQFCGVER